MFVSKGNGLNAEWGESPREPVTVKLQLREISQIRAWAWNKSDALSTVCFLPAGAPAGKSAFVGAVRCESRFYFFAKQITQSVPLHVTIKPQNILLSHLIIHADIEKSTRFHVFNHQFLANFIV